MSAREEAVLLLGMVFSNEFVPKVGQEFRDRVRCESLESLGYSVKTLDDKHDDSKLEHNKHCRANFGQPRRMLKAMAEKWGDSLQLDHIILDYFFSPVGWARDRWTDGFFAETLPELAKRNVISVGGKVWLPNLQCIIESIDRFREYINEFYTVLAVADPMQNPLFVATENAYDEMIQCPNPPSNKAQLDLADPTFPFLALVLKDRANGEQSTAMEYVQKRQKLEDDNIQNRRHIMNTTTDNNSSNSHCSSNNSNSNSDSNRSISVRDGKRKESAIDCYHTSDKCEGNSGSCSVANHATEDETEDATEDETEVIDLTSDTEEGSTMWKLTARN